MESYVYNGTLPRELIRQMMILRQRIHPGFYREFKFVVTGDIWAEILKYPSFLDLMRSDTTFIHDTETGEISERQVWFFADVLIELTGEPNVMMLVTSADLTNIT